MVSLIKVFNRFPNLTKEQEAELCQRRIARLIGVLPTTVSLEYDASFASGYLELPHKLASYRRLRKDMTKRALVVRSTGRAYDVFEAIKQLADNRGEETLGEIIGKAK